MLKKTLVIATLGTALTAGAYSTAASAQGDPLLGALVGGGIGAAIGHSVNGHNGAWVGGAVGALAGASIAANSGYYNGGYGGYYGPSGYVAPAPAYYGPAPVYYGPPPVYAPRPSPISYPVVYGRPSRRPVLGSRQRVTITTVTTVTRPTRTRALTASRSRHAARHPAGLFLWDGSGPETKRGRAYHHCLRVRRSEVPAWRSTIS